MRRRQLDRTGRGWLAAAEAGCALALLLFARGAMAQTAPAAEKTPAAPPTISYAGGLLRISASNSTLGDVLTKVAGLTGVKIEIPPAANSQRMTVVELGPGPARQIVADLLSDSGFDYLLQSSDVEPEKLQSVLIMTREKKGGKPNEADAAGRSGRTTFARAVAAQAKPEEAPALETPVPAQPEPVAADASNPQPAPTPPDQPAMSTPTLPEQPGLVKPINPPPPVNLTPQSISQQLQQMYQQRAQMQQQSRTTGQPVAPPNPGNQ